ncbi:MAG: NAD(+)/NADH kinase [Peptococcaceae bacterium]|nr:NAD(+)/NADH kinase [Peptococcaceae bacterium]
MKSFGLVINLNKKGVRELVMQIADCFTAKGCSILIEEDKAELLDLPQFGVPKEHLYELADCIIAFGGDGTLLGTARKVAVTGKPILGINMGHLGFLTEIDLPEVLPYMEKLVDGEYEIDERMMLQAQVYRQDRVVEELVCLNDAVISKGAFSRIILLEIEVNDEYVNTFPADGMIVATPTGSTAYSLSAGGPLVTPDMDLMMMTPICPHALWARPLLIAPSSVVKIKLLPSQGEIMLTMDGQHGFSLRQDDYVLLRQAPYKAKLIRLKKRSFFDILRKKF